MDEEDVEIKGRWGETNLCVAFVITKKMFMHFFHIEKYTKSYMHGN